MKKTLILICFVLILTEIFSQERTFFASDKNSFWVPTSFSGEIRSFGHLRKHEYRLNDFSDTQNSSRFSVGGIINSKSYFWSPNFLTLDVELEYNPIFTKDNFIIIPDLAETRTMKRLNIKTSLFNNKNISLIHHLDLSQTISNRENLTNINTDRKNWGGGLRFSNKILPLRLSYDQTKWNQLETETGNVSDMDQFNFTGRTSKSFYNNDKHELVYTHNKFLFNRYNIIQTDIISDQIFLNNQFNFDKEDNYSLTSRVSYNTQKGLTDYKRFKVYERLLFKLPMNFIFQNSYNYINSDQELQRTATQNINSTLSHSLFLSLKTIAYFEYTNINNSSFEETSKVFGGNIIYTKKIPLKGRLNLAINSSIRSRNTINNPVSIQIFDESYVLSDAQIVLLERPFISQSSIIVTDFTGAIVYIEGIDYILIPRNNYIEIQRLSGGLIPDSSTIYVDYIVNLPETNSYTSNLNRFSSSVTIFERLFEIYFRAFNQTFNNLVNVDLISLNYYTQYQYGIGLDIKYASAGVEFDNYMSSVVPFKMTRYYLTVNKSIHDRVILSLNANYRDYYLTDEDVSRKYTDISAKAVYRIFDLTRASLDLGYRKQIGTGLDLDLLTARFEITSKLQRLYLTLGLEKYNRDFLGQVNNYNGIYFKLTRKF